MAILKSVVNVNNGNTGWTKKDVIDALETAFANLGWHGGSSVTGAVQACMSPGALEMAHPDSIYPGGTGGAANSWVRCGGSFVPVASVKTRNFYVKNIGTTSYRILEQVLITSSNVNLTNNTFSNTRHPWQTGDEIHWNPGTTNTAVNVGGLTLDTIYYAIRVDDNTFRVAATSADATANNAIDLTSNISSGTAIFRRKDDASFNNATIFAFLGDTLSFTVDDTTSGGKFYLVGNSDNYNANQRLDAAAFNGVNYQDLPSGNGTSSVVWDTGGWRQSEDEVLHGVPHPAYQIEWGKHGLVKYIYANDINSSMKGEIVILPRVANNTTQYKPYWKYTVPASGNRSELKLRIWRRPNYWDNAHIAGITIHNISSGWSDGDTFTIPGNLIGGTTPENDILFGINTNETFGNAYNGICSVSVTNVGAGSSFYQKHDLGFFAVLRNVNDTSKDYGTTYYTFSTSIYNDYNLNINSGSGWNWLNCGGTKHRDYSPNTTQHGRYSGIAGLDFQSQVNYITRSDDLEWNGTIRYASTSTPTAYPLSIRIYRGQAPQDINFAIIQFTQTINGVIVPQGAFSLHKGNSFGSTVFDLDHVFLDSYTRYETGSRDIYTNFIGPAYRVYNQYEPASVTPSYAKLRAASYGWNRDGDSYYSNYGGFLTRYTCNIDTDINNDNFGHVTVYYRNSTYDTAFGVPMPSAANYYKPIKGLPIDNNIVPCPYYMPDDFVMLQVSTTPGLTQFRPGDTVTISQSEIYEIILAGYQNQQNGLDNISNNSTIGMLFMARIV